MINRKLSLLALLAMMLLGVACAPQSTDEPTDGAMEEPTQETVEQPADDDNAACEEGFRPFVDVTGEAVCVPDVAERIVAIHDINAGAQILSLGGPLVGMASRDAGFRDDITRYFDIEGIADVGLVYEPNVEAILELEPDLIVHEGFEGQVSFLDESVVTSLREIAPLVAIDTFRPVEEVMADYEELLGDAATISLDEQRAEFDTLLADIEAVLGDEWQNTTVSLVDVAESNGALQIWGPTALVPLDILTRAGASWVPIMVDAGSEENGGYIGGVSLERIDELDADLTLVDVRFTPETVDDPLYQQLPAVEAGQVILLDEPFSGTHYPNYIATAEILLEQLNALGDIDTELVEETANSEQADTSGAACDEGFRLFDHVLLATDPVCIPEDPERVVSLDALSFDLLLAVDEPPVGAVGYLEAVIPANLPYLVDQIDGIANMGFPANFESVLEVQPDLIIATTLDAEIYDSLSDIAPTVMYQYDASGEWQPAMYFLGDLLNLNEEVDALFADYNDRLTVLGDVLGNPSDVEVSILRVLPDTLMLNLVNSFPSTVVADAGLSRPASQSYSIDEALEVYGTDIGVDVSFEELQLADGEHIFVWGQRASGDENSLQSYVADDSMLALQENPLWQTLGGVQNDQVYLVGGYWVGWGFAAAHSMIDDLFIYLANVDPAEVSPNPFLTGE